MAIGEIGVGVDITGHANDALDFVEDRQRWGAKFRFGLFAVSRGDMQRIAQAMRADLSALGLAD